VGLGWADRVLSSPDSLGPWFYAQLSALRQMMEPRNWPGHVADAGEKRDAYKVLVGNPAGEAPAEGCSCTR
jgi:hypothetical protein